MPGTGSKSKGKKFVGKPFPTYFHFDRHKPGEEHKRTAELGRDVRVTFTTDAQDDYFWRTADRGHFSVTMSHGDATQDVDGTLTLADGLARWTGSLPDNAAVADVVTYDFAVTDSLRDGPFLNRLSVEVRPRQNRGSKPSTKRKRKNEGSGNDDADAGLNLPEVTPVTRNDPAWDEFDFTDESALAVRRRPTSQDGQDAFDFFYNVENESLLRAQKAAPAEAELTRERFRCALVLVGLALLNQHATSKPRNNDGQEVNIEEVVASTTQALAPILLPLVEFVGTLSASPEG